MKNTRIEELGLGIEGKADAASGSTTARSSILAPHSSTPRYALLNPILHSLGLVDYQTTWDAMKAFTAARTADTRDEIWLLQHPPTYTQGLAGLPEHLLNPTAIPVVKIDRGGQITYHGPGQIVAYCLLDMRRCKIGVRELVNVMENAVIALLADYGIQAVNRVDAPGVYVNGAKIAALGLKIKTGYCYHGLSFNVDMDLTPFNNINPCGYQGLQVTQARALGITATINELQAQLAQNLIQGLQQHYTTQTARA